MSRPRLALLIATAATFAFACASTPEAPSSPTDSPPARPAAAPAEPIDSAQEPGYTPFTDRPELLNEEEVFAALKDNFPIAKRDEGGNWVTTVWLYVRDDGIVERMQINASSGDPEMDQAALRVASVMRFSPAENRGERVPVWVSLPITFRTR